MKTDGDDTSKVLEKLYLALLYQDTCNTTLKLSPNGLPTILITCNGDKFTIENVWATHTLLDGERICLQQQLRYLSSTRETKIYLYCKDILERAYLNKMNKDKY